MSEAHGVDPLLVRALIQVESNYQPEGEVPARRHGPDAADALDREGIQGPQPVRSQGQHRSRHQAPESRCIDRLGAPRWRWRPTTPAKAPSTKFNGIPPYQETRDYVTRILALAGLK